MDGAIAVLRQQGAVIVDPADAPSLATSVRDDNFAAGRRARQGQERWRSINFKYGMKRDFNVWATEITEISYVISGAGNVRHRRHDERRDDDGAGRRDREDPDRAQQRGATIDGGQSRRSGPGDVIIVPPGVAHWFSASESDLDDLVFRVDPAHVLPAGYVHQLLKN